MKRKRRELWELRFLASQAFMRAWRRAFAAAAAEDVSAAYDKAEAVECELWRRWTLWLCSRRA